MERKVHRSGDYLKFKMGMLQLPYLLLICSASLFITKCKCKRPMIHTKKQQLAKHEVVDQEMTSFHTVSMAQWCGSGIKHQCGSLLWCTVITFINYVYLLPQCSWCFTVLDGIMLSGSLNQNDHLELGVWNDKLLLFWYLLLYLSFLVSGSDIQMIEIESATFLILINQMVCLSFEHSIMFTRWSFWLCNCHDF